MDGPYGQALRTGVHQALSRFVDLQANPSAPHEDRDAVFRRLGWYEAAEGRSLDGLQAALIVGAQVAWRRLMKVGGRSGLSSAAMALLADSNLRLCARAGSTVSRRVPASQGQVG